MTHVVETRDFGHGDVVVEIDSLPDDWDEAKSELYRRLHARDRDQLASMPTCSGKKKPKDKQ